MMLVVLVTLVAMATAGVVVPNRPYGGYPAYGRGDYGYGYPGYNAGNYAVRKDYVPVRKAGVYDYPYDRYDNNYNYKAVVPVKKVVDPYPYAADYAYGGYPVNKRVNAFPARSVVPVRKGFNPFPAKAAVVPVKQVVDPYPYYNDYNYNDYNFGKVVRPVVPAKAAVFPSKRVVDPFPYQPVGFGVKKVVDPFQSRAVYPVNKVVDPYAYPARKVVNAYPASSVFPARKAVVDPYYNSYYPGARVAVVQPKTVVAAAPVVKKAVPVKKSGFGSFPDFPSFGGSFGKGFDSNFGKDIIPKFKF